MRERESERLCDGIGAKRVCYIYNIKAENVNQWVGFVTCRVSLWSYFMLGRNEK